MSNRSRIVIAVLAAFAGALIAALVIFDDDDPSCAAASACAPTQPGGQPVTTNPITNAIRAKKPKADTPDERKASKTERKASGSDEGKQATEEGPSGPAPTSDPEKQASAAVEHLLSALDRGDGDAVCGAFAPGALDGVRFPKAGPDCPSTVEASLGYRDPRGLPVWKTSKPTGDISAQISGDQARVTATVVTDYEDQRDPSVEDDVLYLVRSERGWLLLKPSATFYRAIGVADVPLDAFKAPH